MADSGFDPAAFKEGRPRLASLPDAVLIRLYGEAEMILPAGWGGASGPGVMDRARVLDIIVCHLAELELRAAEGGGGGVLASASEGSVSVSWGQLTGPAGEAFWNQTSCGQLYLTVVKRFNRGGLYIKGPVRVHPFGW
jgi:hypothetical protein